MQLSLQKEMKKYPLRAYRMAYISAQLLVLPNQLENGPVWRQDLFDTKPLKQGLRSDTTKTGVKNGLC